MKTCHQQLAKQLIVAKSVAAVKEEKHKRNYLLISGIIITFLFIIYALNVPRTGRIHSLSPYSGWGTHTMHSAVFCLVPAPPGRSLLSLAQSLLPLAQSLLPLAKSLLPLAQYLLPTAQSLLPLAPFLLPLGLDPAQGD